MAVEWILYTDTKRSSSADAAEDATEAKDVSEAVRAAVGTALATAFGRESVDTQEGGDDGAYSSSVGEECRPASEAR